MLTGLTHFDLKQQTALINTRPGHLVQGARPYPIHHIPDDAQPVVFPLDPVDSLLLSQVMTDVIEVAVEKDLPLFFGLYHNLPLLLLLGSHIVKFALFVMIFA